MTLATITGTTSPPRQRLGLARATLSLDAFLMAAALFVCAALAAHGGLEASLFAVAGAAISAGRAARERVRAAYSGGFAGLFVGAIFAAIFHDVIVATVRLIS